MLIDTHCHLTDKRYNKTPEQLMKEARSEGVVGAIDIGTSVRSSKNTVAVAKEIKNVFASIGIYPHKGMGEDPSELKKQLQDLISSSDKVVGIGECGIDISDWQGNASIEEQTALFEMQIELALENNLPLIIHNRNGDKIIMEILEKYKGKGLKGVFHCFASDWQFAQKVLDMGFLISFTAIITYPSGKNILDVVKKVPMNKFLLETDAPYLPPQGLRDQVNEPRYVKITAKSLADTKGISESEVADATYKNTCQLFSKMAGIK